MNYILIDTSYWIFYRYYAIFKWWKFAKPDNVLPENPYECTEFVDKFTKTFKESIENLKKKLKINKESCKIIAARDCPRKEIWRNQIYPNYKESRDKDDSFMGGEFFRLVYKDDFLKNAGIDEVLKLPSLEGDDIIAITKNFIRDKYPTASIYIIANDHDYLQLLDEKTYIINFQNKNLSESKKVFPEAKKNLFYKIILGDKSDCIPPVFNKCGPKTVEKYYENSDEFEKALAKYNVKENYELNKKLVDFNEIPVELVNNILKEYEQIYYNL